MPQPDPYVRQHDFTDYSTTYPTAPHNGSWMDEEFNEVQDVLDQILARVELIQRDDGQVANLSIGLDQLKPEIVLGTPTDWVTATAYEIKNVVWHSSVLYVCNTDHTSGVFATDLGAGKWTAYLDYADPLGDAQDAVTAAEAAQAAAEAAQADAETAQTGAEAAQAAAEVAQAAAEAAVNAIVLPLAVAQGGHGAVTAAGARTNLGVEIGSDVQAYSAVLAAYAAGASPTAPFLSMADDASISAIRTTLALGTAATQNTGTSGANVPLLNGTNTWSGKNSWTGGGSNNPRSGPVTDPAFELMNAASTQNWYVGIKDSDSSKLYIGRGYGPAQGITPAIKIDTSDVAAFAARPTFGGLTALDTGNGAQLDAANTFTGGMSHYHNSTLILRRPDDNLLKARFANNAGSAIGYFGADATYSFVAYNAALSHYFRQNATTGVFEVDGVAVVTTGLGATTSQAGIIEVASQAEMEAASSVTLAVSPGNQKYHPGTIKEWVAYTDSTTATITASLGVSSLTDNGSADATINHTTAFSSANYSASGMVRTNGSTVTAAMCVQNATAPSTTALRVETCAGASGALQHNYGSVQIAGDQ